mgnify:CR=1 FL=1
MNVLDQLQTITAFERQVHRDKVGLEFDDAFEAILGDPESYIKNLVGAGLYGCVVRKTTKTGKWFDNYLTSVVDSVIVDNVKSITNLK